MIQLALGIFTVGLGLISLYNASSLDIPKISKEALIGVAVLLGVTKIRKGWKHTESKYFTQIKYNNAS